jgi:hypothetical protein
MTGQTIGWTRPGTGQRTRVHRLAVPLGLCDGGVGAEGHEDWFQRVCRLCGGGHVWGRGSPP